MEAWSSCQWRTYKAYAGRHCVCIAINTIWCSLGAEKLWLTGSEQYFDAQTTDLTSVTSSEIDDVPRPECEHNRAKDTIKLLGKESSQMSDQKARP